ncbi:MAG: CPBP family intramembrane glutamic endopeptidase [Actinomycetota bacterium]
MEETTRESRVGASALVLGFAVGLIASTLIVAVAAGIADVDEFDDLSLWWLLPAQLGLWAGMLGIPYLVARLNRERLIDPSSLLPDRRDVGLGVLVGLGMQLVVIPLVYWPLLPLLDDDADLSEAARELTDRADGAAVIALVLISVVGAPIVEEIFHRGLVQPRLIPRLGPPAAIGVTSVLFAASHVQLLQFPALVLFGVAVGFLALSRSLGAAIVAHVVFNATAVVTLLAT